MIRQEDLGLPPSAPTNPETTGRKPQRRVIVSAAALVAIAAIVAAALLIPQGAGSTMQLNLNYIVGEQMVYQITNVVTNQMANTTLDLPGETSSQSYNSTLQLDILEDKGEYYAVDEKISTSADLFRNIELPPIPLNISKTAYYNNFMAPGGPLIFYNATNPTILSYLSQPAVKAGDVWTIPVNTGNASLGLTGEVTLKFVGIEEITVPASTYTVMRIEVTSSNLSVHADNSIFATLQGMTLQLNGTSYIEQSTCRLIKADMTQTSNQNSAGVDKTSTMYIEKGLIEHNQL